MEAQIPKMEIKDLSLMKVDNPVHIELLCYIKRDTQNYDQKNFPKKEIQKCCRLPAKREMGFLFSMDTKCCKLDDAVPYFHSVTTLPLKCLVDLSQLSDGETNLPLKCFVDLSQLSDGETNLPLKCLGVRRLRSTMSRLDVSNQTTFRGVPWRSWRCILTHQKLSLSTTRGRKRRHGPSTEQSRQKPGRFLTVCS